MGTTIQSGSVYEFSRIENENHRESQSRLNGNDCLQFQSEHEKHEFAQFLLGTRNTARITRWHLWRVKNAIRPTHQPDWTGTSQLSTQQKVTGEDARRLLALSREAHWTFPTSQGTPVREDSGPGEWVERMVAARDSFTDATRFLMENGEGEAAVEIAANVWRLWVMSRDPAGGRAFLGTVLDHGERKMSRARALALYGDGLLAFKQGRLEESRQRSQAALDAARAVNDPEALVLAHLGLARVAFEEGEYRRANSLALQARELARSLDPSMGQAPLFIQAQATRLMGDCDQAAALFGKSVDLNRRLGDEGMVRAELQNLGLVEIHRGNVDAAEWCFSESEKLGVMDDPYSKAMSYLYSAVVTFMRGDRDRSRALLASSRSTFKEAGVDPAPDDQFEIDWLLRQLAKKRDESTP